MTLLDVALICCFCGLIFYVVFGQTTVRKLRKNPETKHRLGVEFASGWDIINVAQALSLPRVIGRVINRGPLGALYVNTEVLYEHTTILDRWLARIVYWLLVTSTVTMLYIIVAK